LFKGLARHDALALAFAAGLGGVGTCRSCRPIASSSTTSIRIFDEEYWWGNDNSQLETHRLLFLPVCAENTAEAK